MAEFSFNKSYLQEHPAEALAEVLPVLVGKGLGEASRLSRAITELHEAANKVAASDWGPSASILINAAGKQVHCDLAAAIAFLDEHVKEIEERIGQFERANESLQPFAQKEAGRDLDFAQLNTLEGQLAGQFEELFDFWGGERERLLRKDELLHVGFAEAVQALTTPTNG
jgi:hypothetical protein